MTKQEIDAIFSPDYAGLAQISDLRLLLSKLVLGDHLGGGQFFEVANIPEMEALTDIIQGDICLVLSNLANQSETYIYDNGVWKVMVIATGGGGIPAPTYNLMTENFIVSTLDQDHAYMDLAYVPQLSEHFFIFLNGLYMILGVGFDCTISNNRLLFNPGVLNAGDHLVVKYSY